ncbi:MAG: glycosyltransferase family 2 protein [Sulfuricaulis sp.]|uniref:glycosyltransferase family 2 protein n=1 Tax=Sulfuricaulis sp. TaxID=2003553 RepID=UPI0034A55C06
MNEVFPSRSSMAEDGDVNKNLTDLAVIILTFNEEANIAQALESVIGWAGEIFVLDSFSTDRTIEITERYPCSVHQNRFENFANQRNFALNHLPIRSEWIFFLDADEWLPKDLKTEISDLIVRNPDEIGFYIKRRLIWMGRWIRRGYYPSWILRLFRRGHARCEDRTVNEHLIVSGSIGHLNQFFVHEDRKGVSDWIVKHNGYAMREALELIKPIDHGVQEINARFWGTQAERKRWLRHHVWNRMPPLVRPIFYFIYRYVLSGGFLDGREAFIYHFLQALWYPMLIDVKYLEVKRANAQKREP